MYCTNPDCAAKHIKAFEHFCSRDAINIIGLSEETLKKFISKGFLHNFKDLYHLEEHKDEICMMDGFGVKSYNKMHEAIENSRTTTFEQFLYSLGIPTVGRDVSKILAPVCNYSIEQLVSMLPSRNFNLKLLDGIGDVIAENLMKLTDPDYRDMVFELLKEFKIQVPEQKEINDSLSGLTFVITGSLEHFSNRAELKQKIEEMGGKVSGSVSKKTTALINNDVTSTTGKNKKAMELGIDIFSEKAFMEEYL